MNIEQELENWDGTSGEIDAIYSRHNNDVAFASKIINLIRQTDIQKGTTWLLKRHMENNRKLETNEIAVLFKLLPKLEHWETKLHILQCIPYMPIGKPEKKNVEVFLRKCLIDDNKFIRAWAYNGFYEMSLQFPEYKVETRRLFETAMRDEAPSVKARIRNIMKKGF